MNATLLSIFSTLILTPLNFTLNEKLPFSFAKIPVEEVKVELFLNKDHLGEFTLISEKCWQATNMGT